MKMIRGFFITAGAALILGALVNGATTNFTVGIIAEFMLGAACALLGVFWNTVKKWLRAAVAGGLAFVLCCAFAVYAYGVRDTVDYSEDVLIVLGAAVHGQTPSLALSYRLDAAAEYLGKNKNAYVIVTGGQGPQEDITEAAAMEKYLVEKGIASERIIKEEKATSTSENYRYSKEIIDNRFPSAKIATLTNDFHMYRAKNIARLAGVDTAAFHAKTPKRGIAAMYLRELMAIVKLWVFKN